MPDPFLYLQAIIAAAGASAISALALGRAAAADCAPRTDQAGVLATGFGLVVGCYFFRTLVSWPPVNALDRLLIVVLPTVVVVELFAGCRRVPACFAWGLRWCLAMLVSRVLLHASVYLAGGQSGWTFWQAAVVLATCGGLLAAVWASLVALARRGRGISIPLALSQAAACAGLAVMMGGYLAGGEVALALAAALAGAVLGTRILTVRAASEATIGTGVVTLFGLLFIGRFFGALSTSQALTVFLAPLLCWTGETRLLRGRKHWLVAALCLALVAIPLLVVFAVAKRDFNRDMLPLLGR
jgi:hypothetical protein